MKQDSNLRSHPFFTASQLKARENFAKWAAGEKAFAEMTVPEAMQHYNENTRGGVLDYDPDR